MFKKLRKKVFIAAFTMIAATGVCIPSMADENQLRAGTERNFSGTLPEGHGNKYYTTRTRQTNMDGGYVKVKTLSAGCKGIDAWICKGSTETVCSTIVEYVTPSSGQKWMRYEDGITSGSKVRLGIEDADLTGYFGRHKVTGIVNYN